MNETTIFDLEQFFEAALGIKIDRDILMWPPDVFCLLSALLQKTGAYIRLTAVWPPRTSSGEKQELSAWIKEIEDTGKKWWQYASDPKLGLPCPAEVERFWITVNAHGSSTLTSLGNLDDERINLFWDAVLQLTAAADCACAGVGTLAGSPFSDSEEAPDLVVEAQGMLHRSTAQGRATLCRRVQTAFGSVLPKMHTP